MNKIPTNSNKPNSILKHTNNNKHKNWKEKKKSKSFVFFVFFISVSVVNLLFSLIADLVHPCSIYPQTPWTFQYPLALDKRPYQPPSLSQLFSPILETILSHQEYHPTT